MPASEFNKKLAVDLCASYASSKRRNIKLPDPRHFKLSGNTGTVKLSLTAEAVVRNMQEDVAAFEGWLLALKAWGCLTNAELSWKAPENRCDGHYQRFLYRVKWFEDLFGSWFSVAPECRVLLDESRVKDGLIVGVAAGTPKDNIDSKFNESSLEKYLDDSCWLASTFALTKVGRQFPVGLFESTVSRGTSIFTAGKSAVDLIGIEGNAKRLWVFELKAKGNQPMGIVSELFFYVAFMRDVIGRRFVPKGGSSTLKGRLHPGELEGVEEIRGCLLAPKFHPLLDDDLVVNLLNTAVWPGDIKVGFCAESLPDSVVARAAI